MINVLLGRNVCLTIEGLWVLISPYVYPTVIKFCLICIWTLILNKYQEQNKIIYFGTVCQCPSEPHIFSLIARFAVNEELILKSFDELSYLVQRSWGYSLVASWWAGVGNSHCLTSVIGCSLPSEKPTWAGSGQVCQKPIWIQLLCLLFLSFLLIGLFWELSLKS